MKSLIISIGILVVVGLVIGVMVMSSTQQISCTVTPMQIALTVTPTTTTYSTMSINQVRKADTANADDEFIVTNTGNVAQNFDVLGADATGGVTWTLSTSTVGQNIYMHAYSALKTLAATTTLGSNPDLEWVALDKGLTYKTLKQNIAPNTSCDLVLQLLTPSSVTDYQTKSTTVTVRATAY